MRGIYEGDFAFYLAKYADNGRAETISELEEYFKMYKQRAGREYLYQTFLDKSRIFLPDLSVTIEGLFYTRKLNKFITNLSEITRA